jgi:hypothetical protein
MTLRTNRTRYIVEALVLGALAVAVLMPWGCSRSPQDAMGPGSGNTFPLPNGVIAHPGTIKSESIWPSDPVYSTSPLFTDSSLLVTTFDKVIGLAGGVIAMPLGDSETSYFTVVAGALLANTRITADVYREQVGVDIRHTEFHFGPDGLLFRLPALLSYKTAEVDGSILNLYWWDPTAQDWVVSAQAVVVLGYATFPVLHFSDYRVVDRISLGGQRGTK